MSNLSHPMKITSLIVSRIWVFTVNHRPPPVPHPNPHKPPSPSSCDHDPPIHNRSVFALSQPRPDVSPNDVRIRAGCVEMGVAICRKSPAFELEHVSRVLDRERPCEVHCLRDEVQKTLALLQTRIVVERLPHLSADILS